MNGLDLFSGIGGLSLALQEWVKPIAYCEIDPYCQGVLLSRMASGQVGDAPIWDNIQTMHPNQFADSFIDIIYGGFPCQDISVAGHGKGLEGKRSSLFFEIMRLAKEIKPKFIFIENVPAITSRGGLRVVKEITEMGYDCRWCVISAAAIGALHRRERWFLLGYAKHNGSSTIEKRGSLEASVRTCEERKNETSQSEGTDTSSVLSKCSMAHANSQECSGLSEREEKGFSLIGSRGQYATKHEWQETVSKICRVTDGIPYRVDRIRALGNAVVPSQAKEAFEVLMGIKPISLEESQAEP